MTRTKKYEAMIILDEDEFPFDDATRVVSALRDMADNIDINGLQKDVLICMTNVESGTFASIDETTKKEEPNEE